MNSTRYHYSHGLRASGQDLESIDALEDYIDRSQVIMIFVSKGYFLSTNCLREARTAVAKAKPLALVHDPVRGGATLETIKANECPLELQGIFKDNKIIDDDVISSIDFSDDSREVHADAIFRSLQETRRIRERRQKFYAILASMSSK